MDIGQRLPSGTCCHISLPHNYKPCVGQLLLDFAADRFCKTYVHMEDPPGDIHNHDRSHKQPELFF